MGEFTIQLATPGDANRIAAISRDHIEQGLDWHYDRHEILLKLRDPDTNVITARCGSDLAGFAIMNYVGFEAHLILFAVLPAYRRRGAGAALIRWPDPMDALVWESMLRC